MKVVKAANELRVATFRCDLPGVLQARIDFHSLAASSDGLLQDCHRLLGPTSKVFALGCGPEGEHKKSEGVPSQRGQLFYNQRISEGQQRP